MITHHMIVLIRQKKIESNKFRIKHLDNKIPMVYSILAAK